MKLNQSLTISSLAVMILLNLLTQVFGIEIGDANFTEFINTGGTIMFGLVAWYGRVRKGDITILGRRK